MTGTEYAGAVLQARQGNQDAITALYTATQRVAYGIARQYVKDEDNALDVLQTAYVKAFENLDKLQSPDKFDKWLNRIVQNQSKDFMKKKTAVLFSQMGEEDSDPIEFEDDRAAGQPDAAMDYTETKRLVRQILDSLSDEQRLVTLMFYFENLSVKEIAAQLGVPENTVKSRLNYARQKIKLEVLALEKEGTKLYSMAPLPFFLAMLRGGSVATDLPVAASAALAKGIQAKLAADAAAASGAGASSAAAASAAAGAKAAGGSLALKIVAGVVAAGLVIGGGFAVARGLWGGAPESASLPAGPAPSIVSSSSPFPESAVADSVSTTNPISISSQQEGIILDADVLTPEIIAAAQGDALDYLITQIAEHPEYYPSHIWILNSVALGEITSGQVYFTAPEHVQTNFYAGDAESGYSYESLNFLCFTYRVGVTWEDGHTSEMYITVRVPGFAVQSDGSISYEGDEIDGIHQTSSLEKMQEKLENYYGFKYETFPL